MEVRVMAYTKTKDWHICKVCGLHNTFSTDQICCFCRRKPVTQKVLCKVCGARETASEDGLCYVCRRAIEKENANTSIASIDNKILELETDIQILKYRKQGLSFADIGNLLGMPTTTVYYRFNTLLGG
jgi:predicted amidophosphoribosyltransferase